MKRAAINPWAWQERLGFAQAVDVTAAQRVLYCSGQTAVDADGTPQHAGDLRGQVGAAIANLRTVLETAGLGFGNVVRLTVYTTDVQGLVAHWDAVMAPFREAGSPPASTLLGVARLARPEFLVELEATAVA